MSQHRPSRVCMRNSTKLAAAAGKASFEVEGLEARTLFAADPVTSNDPLFTAVNGPARIDGVIRDAEWAGSTPITRIEPHDDKSNMTLRFRYNAQYLFVAADVRDEYLWADGEGGGTGDRWDFWEDDGMALFFDPRNTRAKKLPASGRMFAFNIGAMTSPINGPGRVERWEFLKGNGKGGGALTTVDGSLYPGLKWAVKLNGTVNNNSDVDVGWTAEARIPWAALGMASKPVNGDAIGMNFEFYFDNDGGKRSFDYYGQGTTDPVKRVGQRIVDDHINGVFSSFNAANTGWNGPFNYGWLQFNDRAAADRPQAITDLSVSGVTGYGVKLEFTAPAATERGKGTVGLYQIRTSLSPIVTEEDWGNATEVENNFVPHLKGKAEVLKIGRLEPGTHYYVAVRPVDLAGREGEFITTDFITQGAGEDLSGGGRLMVSPNGGYLITEAGDPFVMVGGMASTRNLYIRGLYEGLIWNATDGTFVNISERVGQANFEGDASGYFDAITEYGVNTLRLQLEWLQLADTPEARSQLPEGMPWLEWREPGDTESTFNENMKTFLHSMMEEAARTGVYFILQTFNNFNYERAFDLTPYTSANGGPIDSMAEFFGSAQVQQMAQRRLDVLTDWIRESPYAYTVMGFELINEWDGGLSDLNELPELRKRAAFMTELADHVHEYSPEFLVMSTTIGMAPRGPVARAVFYSDAFDMLDPHYYTPSTAEPVNNVDDDKSVRPAIDYGNLAAYWITSRRDNRPVHNAEWDLVERRWPSGAPYYTGYSENADPDHPFYLEEDEAIYRTTAWTMVASGLAGGGLRIGGSELRDTYPAAPTPDSTGYLPVPLSIGMRQTQAALAGFVQDDTLGFDWSNYRARTLSGRVGVLNAGTNVVHAYGSTDSNQGMVYVLRDRGRSPGGQVTNADLRIEGLLAGVTYAAEVWSTSFGGSVISTITGVVAGAKYTIFDLPSFTTDVMVNFRRVA